MNIVEQLKQIPRGIGGHYHDIIQEAILYIELLRAERDEARREVCQMKGTVRWNHYFPHFGPKGYAENRGWDCHKEDGK